VRRDHAGRYASRVVVVGAVDTQSPVARSRRPVLVTAVVIALVVGIVFGRAVLASPHVFTYGNEVTTSAHVGDVVLIGMGPSTANIVIRHAEPVFANGSRPAVTSVVACTKQPGSSALWSMGTAAGWAWLNDHCSRVVPAKGAHLHRLRSSSDSNDYLVLAVAPLAGPGYVMINGIDVAHGGRWHDVTERAGTDVRIGVYPSR